MDELTLSRDERLALRARAHHLNPVVLLGSAGLTEAVIRETDRALTAHELIKVRIPSDDRDEREEIGVQLAGRVGAARVQVIGKLLVLYRPRPEAEARPAGPASGASRARPAAGAGPARPATGTARKAPAAAPRPRRPSSPRGSGGRPR